MDDLYSGLSAINQGMQNAFMPKQQMEMMAQNDAINRNYAEQLAGQRSLMGDNNILGPNQALDITNTPNPTDEQIKADPRFKEALQKKMASETADGSSLPHQTPPPAGMMKRQENDLIKEFKEKHKSYMDRRQKLVDNLHEKLKIMNDGYTPQLNLRPLMAWSDSELGTNFARSYQDPNAVHQAQKAQLESQLLQQEDKMHDDSREHFRLLLNERMAANKQRSKEKMEALFNPKVMRFTQDTMKAHNYEGRAAQNVKKAVSKMEKVRAGLGTIDLFDRGDIVFDDKNAADMSTAITSIIMDGGQPAQSLIDKGIYNSAMGSGAKLAQYITANPKQFYSKEIMAELKKQFVKHGKLATDAISRHQSGVYNRSRKLRKLDPDFADSQRQTYGKFFEVGKDDLSKPRKYTDEEYYNMMLHNELENPNPVAPKAPSGGKSIQEMREALKANQMAGN